MEIDQDNQGPDTHLPGAFSARLRIVVNIIQWLTRLVMPTEQDLIQAGVYLGESHDEELFDEG